MAGKAIDELAVGEAAEWVRIVTRGDIDRYAHATGDANHRWDSRGVREGTYDHF